MTLRILVVDDHDLVRAGVSSAARELTSDAEVYNAASIEEALGIFDRCPDIDLVLLDLVLPDAVGFSGLEAVIAKSPDVPVILLTADVRKETMEEAFSKGALGYIPKSSNMTIIVNALRIILAGGRYLPAEMLGSHGGRVAAKTEDNDGEEPLSQLARNMGRPETEEALRFNSPDPYGLTSRQCDVAHLLSQGMSNKEICRELDLSVSTVKTHVASILRALRTSSRTKAMAILADHAAQTKARQ